MFVHFFGLFLALNLFVERGDFFKLPNLAKNDTDDVHLEIVNGHFASSHGDFPYQVSLFALTNDPKPGWGTICGGVIMNSEWVITAAHCVQDANGIYDPSIMNVRVGLNKLDDASERTNTYKASEIYSNPNYEKGTYFNDVALIKVAGQIQFNDQIQPACFDYSERQYGYMIVSGYGKVTRPVERNGVTIDEGEQGNELKFAYVKENRQADFCDGITKVCIQPYYQNSFDSSCKGDSGGPLSTPDKKVVGVFSTIHSIKDGSTVYWCVGNSQYTRLSRFRNWINQHVGTNYCYSF